MRAVTKDTLPSSAIGEIIDADIQAALEPYLALLDRFASLAQVSPAKPVRQRGATATVRRGPPAREAQPAQAKKAKLAAPAKKAKKTSGRGSAS